MSRADNVNAIKKRRLKVYYGYHSNSFKQHPVIRLGGEYLVHLDFKIGDLIEITMHTGQILITKIEP